MGVGEVCRQPGGLDGGGGIGNGGGDPTASVEGRQGVGVQRGPAGIGTHGGRATTAVAEDKGHNAKAVVSPFERQAEAPTLAPCKALKVSTSSTTQWVEEAQATIQHGVALARADPKEPVAQGEATEVAMKQAGEEAPTPREAGALGIGEVKAPSITEATEGKVEAEVAEARVSRASKAVVVDTGAPRTTEAEVVEAGAPGPIEAEVVEAEVEDLRYRYADMKAKATTAREQAIPLVVRIKELEEELTRVADERDTFSIDLEAVSDDYVVADDDKKAEEEVMKLVEAAEAPSTALAGLFEEEVVPPTSTADAGDLEF
ncbi:uncharacterized protein [Miscanthus floridulus]|uniref:uncharacterized protein n=1 Tax=Miscanthus floridulus TaxID=154761 RepID=UPI0034577D6B